jgi:Ca-activated chloride channel family protein
LARDDTRAKEIKQLGLDYNLLTEFTSFVAIDSLPRNVGDQSTTIRQPLPLPQGVSDLAVGGGRMLHAMSPALPGRTGTMDRAAKFDRKAESETNLGVNHLAENMLISGNLSKKALEKFILEHLKEIGSCHTGIKNPANGKLSVKIDIDGGGKVLKVEAGIDEINNRVLKSCIIQLVKGWTLPAPSDGKSASVEVFLVFNF